MLNTITLDRQDVAEAFGPVASYVLLHHRARLSELITSGLEQMKLNHIFNQTGFNTHFVVNREGDVIAAGSESHCKAYHNEFATVLVERQLGCGRPTHVAGTNGGTVPCGANLTVFGKTAPYFCAKCDAN